MPEFPEVNHHVRWLRRRVVGWEVSSFGYVGKHFPAHREAPGGEDALTDFFRGAVIQDVTQRGKMVVLRLSSGVLLAHLMFKGRWSLAGEDYVSKYKQHVDAPTPGSNTFWIESLRGRLNFHEPERLGKVHAFPGKRPAECDPLAELGPEIVLTPETDPDFTGREWDLRAFVAAARAARLAVKAFLLDQKRQSGFGNMYACEALYRARVNPARPANSLSADECERIYEGGREVVRRAIANDLAYDDGVIAVYRKESDPEGRPVECCDVGGRDTFWVPSVQT